MTKIKICGITNLEDAKAALDLGVDALGFNFYEKSPRAIAVSEAQSIVRQLPADIWSVGVFVNHQRSEVERIARTVSLNTLQFHGDETLDFISGWPTWNVIRAVRVKHTDTAQELEKLLEFADYLLLDKFSESSYGGGGELISDDVIDNLLKHSILERAFLAGGLAPANVLKRIEKFRPFGVDVASGVESEPGIKDREKLADFTFAVRSFKL